MARANITVPAAATAGLREELLRLEKLAALDAYLRELEVEQGPIPESERAEADEWATKHFGPPPANADRAA